jgi:hypothetical protein
MISVRNTRQRASPQNSHIPSNTTTYFYVSYMFQSRGLSGYRARRQVADSQGHVLVAGLSLNKIGDRGPTPQPQDVMCGLP